MTWQDFFMLGGGLGLFLFGMKMMGDELERAAGNSLRHLLEVLTRNRLLGLLVGMLFTMLVQSSSATTVMVVGFVNAGLMDLYQAAGVIFGANIGTTITAQLIAFKLSDVAPAILLVGVVMYSFSKKSLVRQIGGVIAGCCILFVGLDLMSDSMSKLRDMPEVAEFLAAFGRVPILGVLAGLLITVVIQSSSASVGILQVLAAQGLIGLDAAIFIVMGQNIGTTVTAMLASLGGNKVARRTAILHLMFNIFSTILFFILVCVLPVTDWIAATAPDDPMRQVANAHMVFNIFGVVVFFPFINKLVRLTEIIVPGEDTNGTSLRLQFLNDSILSTPPAALAQAIKEIHRMQGLANQNIQVAIDLFVKGKADDSSCTDLEDREALINYLNHEITKYLVLINQTELSDHEGSLVGELFHVVNDIERIGDHAENIMELAQARERDKVVISDAGLLEINEMYAPVRELLETALSSFDSRDANRATRAYALEQRVDEMDELLRQRHIDRLNKNLCTPESGMLFTDVATNLERVADHAINIITAADMD